MTAIDVAYGQPPRLYTEPGHPPADAWDLQIAAPPPLVAWIEARRQRGLQSGIYIVGAGTASDTVAHALPGVAMRSERHVDPAHNPYPHVHVLLAARGADGQLLERETLQVVATEAWIAHVHRMVGYARERSHLGLQWQADGSITGIDHAGVPPFSCTEFDWLERPPVLPQL